ncbi:nitronate monooxygenase [Marmoricola sp. RAF53]|uniref:nitronate monooxygenase n=1 Tax=Marmoricola sp. RAF53 TaxID=3233059 RepID=UPI003F95EEF4
MARPDLRSLLGLDLPVVAAPMAGGPTTPGLVTAAAGAGSLGFLAAGYRTAADLADQVAAVRGTTGRFGVNLFAPPAVRVDPAAYRAYRERLLPWADRLGVELPSVPVEDDDGWQDKVAVLEDAAPPVVSFTFGLPDHGTVRRLRRAGSLLAQTVTSAAEARAADGVADLLVVQSGAAGGHHGTFTPAAPEPTRPLPELVAAVRAVTDLPVIAGGGVGGAEDVVAALAAGADLVAIGTLLLLADEAGTSAAYRAGLADPERADPVVTRAFSGRPARGLPNAFLRAHDAAAPLGYPAVHHLTSPIRRAAAANEDPSLVNLWAGAGHRGVRAAPAAHILGALAGRA